jgi:magnesium-transporting ATPase (P-type)
LKIEEEATSVHCRDSLADQVIARALDVNHGSSNSQGAGVRSIPNREEHPPLDRSAGAEGASLSAVPHLTPLTGLTSVEATLRIDRGQTNDVRMGTSRTLSEILRANILTRFNLILGSLLALILAIGPIQDALFGIVLVVNALVGIVQELRAKRTLDRLAILNEPRARLMRNGVLEDAPIKAVVLDDLVHVRTGDQIVADGIVRATEGLQIDESLLTGESEPVQKSVNDSILSGSFVVAGSCDYQATGVGLDAYAATLAVAARRFKLTSSELMEGINRLLRYVTWAIFPVAGLLLWSQLRSTPNWRDAASGVVAGLIAMVPQGLVLLTSIAFAIAVVTLARRNVLVQELPAVEVLARVDIVCIDKTGTLTDGTIIFDRVERLDKDFPIDDALGALGHGGDSNATLGAIGAALANPAGWCRTDSVPFSSARKWSGATFTDHGTVILGAPELIADVNDDVAVLASGAELAKTGLRVLLLASTDDPLDQETLPRGLRPLAFVLLREKVRPDAAETLAFFVQQGVAIKVISGDSPHTVGAVAALVGVAQAGEPVDARELPDDLAELGLVLEQRSVFGRVTPQQKQTMVAALQARTEDRRHRHRDGLGRTGDTRGRPGRSTRRPLRHASRRRRRRSASHRQHREGVQPFHHQDRVGHVPRDRRRRRALALSPAATTPDHHRRASHRHTGVLPRLGPQCASVPTRVRRPGTAIRTPRRTGRRLVHVRGLLARPIPPLVTNPATDLGDTGWFDGQLVRTRTARLAIDVAASAARRSDDRQFLASVPGLVDSYFLRT